MSPDARLLLPLRIVVLLLLSLLPGLACAQWLSDEQAIMGTSVRVELWAEDRVEGESAIAAVMDEMRHIDQTMSPFIETSELSRINREAADAPLTISPELFSLIKRALEFSDMTGGAFDITFSSVGYLYDYRRHIKPSEEEIQRALPGVNYRHVILDQDHRTIRFARKGVRIDLGGIAKGYAVDACVAILKQRGFVHALVSAGGDSRVMGDHLGRPWMIGIRDPRHKDKTAAMLPLADVAVSTSGDYERYFEADGVRYHHIINPKTGHSATGVHSATIIAPDATTTDGLSTSVFVMGVEKGMALIDSLHDVDAIIIDQDGKLFYSRGLKEAATAAEANSGKR
jgi:thiamine biosynthesis lipoprotein